jgi:hypothetical protein
MKKKKERNFVARELASRRFAQRIVPDKRRDSKYEVAVEIEETTDSWYKSMYD